MRITKLISAKTANTFGNRIKNTLHHILKDNNEAHIVKLDIVVNDTIQNNFNEEYECIVDVLKSVFKDRMPAFSIIFQNISSKEEFVIHYQMYEEGQIQYKSLLNHPYVTISHKTGIEVISGAISFKEDSLLFSAQRCFDFAEQILMTEDLNFGHIYRQWNYIPDINGSSEYDRHQRGNLHIFNEIKSIFFEEALFINGKPLISNINNLDPKLILDFNAFNQYSENSHTENHTNMHSSPENVGINSKYIYIGNNEYWFKSVSDSDSFSHDIEEQTTQTLKNIFSLKDKYEINQNIEEHLKVIRVKIKNGQDYKKVEKLIKSVLPKTEKIITNTEFNQPAALIEIEGLISY